MNDPVAEVMALWFLALSAETAAVYRAAHAVLSDSQKAEWSQRTLNYIRYHDAIRKSLGIQR